MTVDDITHDVTRTRLSEIFSAALKLKIRRHVEKNLLVRYGEGSVDAFKENVSLFAHATARTDDNVRAILRCERSVRLVVL